MNWQETVLADEEIIGAYKVGWLPNDEEELSDRQLMLKRGKCIARVQAKVAFKAGQQEARSDQAIADMLHQAKQEVRREVVEWVKKHDIGIKNKEDKHAGVILVMFWGADWQGQQEEWHLEEQP